MDCSNLCNKDRLIHMDVSLCLMLYILPDAVQEHVIDPLCALVFIVIKWEEWFLLAI